MIPSSGVPLPVGLFSSSHFLYCLLKPGSPAQPYPEFNVVSNGCPERFQLYPYKPSQTELPEPELFFNPGIGELSHFSPLLIYCLCFICFHLCNKCFNNRIILYTGDSTSFSGMWTAGRFGQTAWAFFSAVHICLRGQVLQSYIFLSTSFIILLTVV